MYYEISSLFITRQYRQTFNRCKDLLLAEKLVEIHPNYTDKKESIERLLGINFPIWINEDTDDVYKLCDRGNILITNNLI